MMFSSGAFGFASDYILLWVLFASIVIHTWCFFRFFPRDKHKRTGLVLGNALVLMTMLGTVFLIAESYFRFVAVHTDAFGMSLPAQRWFAIYGEQNELGLRDEDWSAGDLPGVRRIAFVGDSYTYGWGIEDPADRFPDLIEKALNDRGQRVQTMNIAKPGWGTSDQIQPIKDMVNHYGVDEVVLCYVPNDIEKLLPRTDAFDPTEPPIVRWFNLDSSVFADYLYRLLVLPHSPTVKGYMDWLGEGFASEPAWRAHQSDLGEIISFCRDKNVPLRVVLLPFIAGETEKFKPQAIHATLKAFFEKNGVPVVDLLPVILEENPRDLIVNELDGHPNEKAHAMFAEKIKAALFRP